MKSQSAPGGGFVFKGDRGTMTAWDELQQWLMMNVGSKEADECIEIVRRVLKERRP